MFQIRIHGRGGQGAVTAAELLSVAAFLDGGHAQAFPSFGSERTGAPVVAFCRIDTRPIRVREPVMRPDALVIQDATLLHQVNVFEGLRPWGSHGSSGAESGGGFILINSPLRIDELGLEDLTAHGPGIRMLTVPASALAVRHFGRPVPNAVLLGGLAALTECVRIGSLTAAIRDRFPGELGAANAAAAQEAYNQVLAQVRAQREEPSHAQAD